MAAHTVYLVADQMMEKKNQKIQLWLLNEIGFRRDYLKSSL